MLRGEVDVHAAPSLRGEIYALVDANRGDVVALDLADVDFIDSAGLGVLVGALKHARLSAGDIVVTDASPHVRKVFTLTGLHKIFKIERRPLRTEPVTSDVWD